MPKQFDGWTPYRGGPFPSGPCVYYAERVEMFARRGSVVVKIGSSIDVRRRLGEFGDVYRLVRFLPCDSVEEARRIEKDVHASVPWPRAGEGREFYVRRV